MSAEVPATATELALRCVEVAHAFRLAHEPEGHALLPSVIAGIERALELGLIDAGAAGPVLQVMLEAQERGDLLLVADVLEHVLAPSLAG